MPLVDKHSNFVTQVIVTNERLLASLEDFQNLRLEWDALGLSTAITDASLTGDNAHITPAILGDAFSSLEALQAVMNAGHRTNLYRLKR